MLICMLAFDGIAQDIPVEAQLTEKMSLKKAMEIAMLNNYDIKIAKASLEKTDNSAFVGNAGLLPSITASGGAEHASNNTEMELMSMNSAGESSSETIEMNGARSTTYDANVRMDYVLFDGLGNVYTYRKLKGENEKEQILYRQQMENTMLEVAELYYEVCRNQQSWSLAKQTLKISHDRYQRVKDQKEVGQASRLDILNAEVDQNADSTSLLQAEQNYLMAIKNLNVAMGISVDQNYSVDEAIVFRDDLDQQTVVQSVMVNNAGLLSQKKQEDISELEMKITKANKSPELSAYGSYGYSTTDNEVGQLLYNKNVGLTVGLTATFNVFNGRQQRIAEKNAKLDLYSEQERTKQFESQLERDAVNAYIDYDYKRKIVNLQETSLKQAELNFETTKEMFALGKVNSIEFRTAQENLLTVANNYNAAQFDAKVAELNLLQLSGMLLSDSRE